MDPEIPAYDEITREIVLGLSWMDPNGYVEYPDVLLPRVLPHDVGYHQTDENPRYIQVRLPRKGPNNNLPAILDRYGLRIADVWQHDRDATEGRIALRLIPKEEPESVFVVVDDEDGSVKQVFSDEDAAKAAGTDDEMSIVGVEYAA